MWWVLRSLLITPATYACEVACVTSDADHVYVAYAPWRPARHPIYRTFRGRTHLCGYQYIWDTPTIAEQTEPGDTLQHTINLAPLTPETTYWAYVFAPDGPYGLEIQGPLFSFTTEAVPPGPQPIPDPIYFNCPGFLHRCGNHYTWYASGTWYAMVPTPTALTIWKLVAGAMVRQDQPNEPTPPLGTISDADSRIQADGALIHCTYYCAVAAPGPHLLRYATFDTTTDTWALDEQICTPTRGFNASGHTSLSLDAAQVPHVIYTEGVPAFWDVNYSNRIGGAWNPPEIAIAHPFRFLSFYSADHAPATNSFHALSLGNFGWHYINVRTAPGVWAGRTNLATAGAIASYHSIATGATLPHFGQTMTTWRMSHHEGAPPYPRQDDLSAAVSRWASMISGPAPAAEIAIIFSDSASQLATLYRPPAQPWDPEVQLPPTQVSTLAATYNHPDVCSALWQSLGPFDLGFWAFDAPWVP